MSSKHLAKAVITNAVEKYGMSLSLEMKLDAKKHLNYGVHTLAMQKALTLAQSAVQMLTTDTYISEQLPLLHTDVS